MGFKSKKLLKRSDFGSERGIDGCPYFEVKLGAGV